MKLQRFPSITALLISLTFSAYSQSGGGSKQNIDQAELQSKSQNVRKLEIGDKIPDVVFPQVENYSKNTMRLSDFKGKKIVLDFWNRYCSACIGAFPDIENLNNELKDHNVVIIPITTDRLEIYKNLKSKSKILKEYTHPIIVGDSIFINLIKPHGVPFYVWVDEYGIIKEKTSGYLLTKSNLINFSQGITFDADYSKPSYSKIEKGSLLLFEEKNSKYRSTIFKVNKTFYDKAFGSTVDSVLHLTKSIKLVDYPLIELFSIAEQYYNLKDIITFSPILTKLLKPIERDSIENWIKNTSYTYEISIENFKAGKEEFKHFNSYLKKDLEKYFKIGSKIDSIDRDVFVLTSTSTPKDIFNLANSRDSIFEITSDGIYIRNCSINKLVEGLVEWVGKSQNKATPVINETNEMRNININVSFARNSIEGINRELRKNGYELVPSRRKIKSLILFEL